MFSKILIANRGEIACRIIKTARRLGIQTVAVYSEADQQAQHVKQADEAWLLGPAPSRESYLRADKIIAIAKATGAQAIHPGYGFLSENAEFSAACQAAGIQFIGPSGHAITAMGSKSGAKALMEKAGVPLIPGYHGEQQEATFLLQQAKAMGFPVLLKASAGGGGKGMRAVHDESEFLEALQAAQREADNAFGDKRMLIEKLLLQPRHVEVQLMADRHGQAFYIFDRDCSLQRRHQKVVEEAPAPGLPESLRHAMGDAAVRAALAINYEGAGTIEFLVQDGEFYFMEMNTRLQVEHPVSEMISGLDLVELQLRVAAGEKLTLQQAALRPQGHAVEVRLYAEDPSQDFLPSTGPLKHFDYPKDLAGVRVDTGFVSGDSISLHYDPMMAKVIAWAETREAAIDRLRLALTQVQIAGVKHNCSFLYRVLGIPAFRAAQLSTRFLEVHQSEWATPADATGTDALAAAIFLHQQAALKTQPPHTQDPHSPWHMRNSWRLSGHATQPISLRQGDKITNIHLQQQEHGLFYAQYEGCSVQASLLKTPYELTLTLNDRQQRYGYFYDDDSLYLYAHGEHSEWQPVLADFDPSHQHTAGSHYQAPMNGRVASVLVHAGQSVEAGDTLLIMEAMKMEHRIRAHHKGKVTALLAAAGELASEGQLLLEFEVAEA